MTALVRRASLFACEPTERLCTAGHPIRDVHVILEGVVRLFHVHATGIAFTAKLMAAPNHIGDLQRLAGGATYGGNAEALSTCVVAVLPYEALQAALAADHPLALAWLSAIASQFAVTIELSQHNLFADVGGRIAHFLASHAEAMATVWPAERAAFIAMSREELALSVGSVRRSVIRALHALEETGAVQVEHDGIRITDHARLRALAPLARRSLAHRATIAENTDVDHCA